MTFKDVNFDIAMYGTEVVTQTTYPLVYTGDESSVKVNFTVTDEPELTGATAVLHLYFADSSHIEKVMALNGLVFSYLLAGTQNDHAGIVRADIFIKKDGATYTKSGYRFRIDTSLEANAVLVEYAVDTLDTVVDGAEGWLLQAQTDFGVAQGQRAAEWVEDNDTRADAFGAAQTSRANTFNASEAARTTAFNASETGRSNTFTVNENAREQVANSGEVTRNADYGTAEASRDTRYDNAEDGRDGQYASAETNRDTQYGTAEDARDTLFAQADLVRGNVADADHTTATSDHGIAQTDHTTAVSDTDRAATDHSAAVTDHSTATTDHTTATADHGIAVADHTSYDGLLTQGVLTTNIATKLTELETTYSPDLLSVKQQLEQKLANDNLANVFASLDMRENVAVTIAQASDSTGDADTEYFELSWKKCFADLWPERTARVQRWFDPGTGGAYTGWNSWQTGLGVPGTVYSDDFSTDSAAVIGTLSPDVGVAYTEYAPHSSYWSVSGGKLTRGGASDGVRATLRGRWNARSVKDFVFTGKINVPVAASNVDAEAYVCKTTEAIARVGIKITGTGVATLSKYFDAVSTTLGTFPAGTYNGVELAFEISLVGTTLTGKLAGNILTATLTQAEVDLIYTETTTVVRSQILATTFDDFLVTSKLPTTLPTASIYNGGAAGKTAEYHRANLAALYPVRPDLIFINHGHNYSNTNGWTVQSMLDSITSFVAELNALYPSTKTIPVVVTSQNPQFGSGREADHLTKIKAIKALAKEKGWGYIPTFEAFAIRSDGGADQMLDSLHPGVGTGRMLQAGVSEKWIKAHTDRPVV